MTFTRAVYGTVGMGLCDQRGFKSQCKKGTGGSE